MGITERFRKIRQEADLEKNAQHAKEQAQLDSQRQLKANESLSLTACEEALGKFGVLEIFEEMNNDSLNHKGKIKKFSEIRSWHEDVSVYDTQTKIEHHKVASSSLRLDFTQKHIPFSLTATVSRDVLRFDEPFRFEFVLSSKDGRDSMGRLHSFSGCSHEPIGFEIDAVCGNTHRQISPKKPDFPHTYLEIKPVLVNNEVKELCLEKIAEACKPAVKAGYL